MSFSAAIGAGFAIGIGAGVAAGRKQTMKALSEYATNNQLSIQGSDGQNLTIDKLLERAIKADEPRRKKIRQVLTIVFSITFLLGILFYFYFESQM